MEKDKNEITSDKYIYDENEEYENGTHSSQIEERIKIWLKEHYEAFDKITKIDFYSEPSTVDVYVDKKLFGKFNYIENDFVDI